MDALQIRDRDSKTELHVPKIIHGSTFQCSTPARDVNLIVQVKDEFQQPAKVFQEWLVSQLYFAFAYYYKCLEFCGLPHLVLLYYTSKHSSIATVRSWTLLQAFGSHGLLMLYVHAYVRTSPLIWFRASR